MDNLRASILVIDDEPANLQQVKAHLVSFGYEASILPRADFLFKRLESESFDLILLDINMPGMDGITALKKLKESPDHQKIPVIMLTGETNDTLVSQCFEIGASDFITKPISPLTLKARVETAISAKRNTEELEKLVELRTNELSSSNLQLEIAFKELERINKTFKLFVPTQFLERITSEKMIRAGDFQKEKLTILFADIRSYTHLVELMNPEENFQLLNKFFGLIEPAITKHHGFIDKFIGDAVMALFDDKHSTIHAVQAAIEMQQIIHEYNQRRKKKGLPSIKFGVGVNTGSVMIGALGSGNRLSSTVIGDHVNLASRVENLTKKFNAQILITHHTFDELPESHDLLIRKIDITRVKGRDQPVVIYEVFESDPPLVREKKKDSLEFFDEGLGLYHRQKFSEALEIFQECLKIFPQDIIALDYLKRCRYFEKYPPILPDNWDGIVTDSDILIDQIFRRRSERFFLDLEAKIIPYGIEEQYKGIVKDLSMGGMRLETELPVRKGDLLSVEVSIKQKVPELELELEIKEFVHQILGKVVWKILIPVEKETPTYEIGLETIMMTDEQEERLSSSLDSLANKSSISVNMNLIDREICIFLLGGEFSFRESQHIKKVTTSYLKDNRIKKVIFNFEYVQQIDSNGIGTMVSLFKQFQTKGITCVVAELPPHIHKSFIKTGLEQFIPIYTKENAAIEDLS